MKKIYFIKKFSVLNYLITKQLPRKQQKWSGCSGSEMSFLKHPPIY